MKHRAYIKTTLLALALTLAVTCHAQDTFKGKVIRIADGDTFTVLTEGNNQVKVRISGIDAPESGQAFGTKSRQWLADRIFGKTVTLEESSKDQYGRSIANVYYEGQDIGLASIRAGMAWHYAHFNDDEAYAAAQKAAQEENLGLWADKDPVNPYEWRKTHKK